MLACKAHQLYTVLPLPSARLLKEHFQCERLQVALYLSCVACATGESLSAPRNQDGPLPVKIQLPWSQQEKLCASKRACPKLVVMHQLHMLTKVLFSRLLHCNCTVCDGPTLVHAWRC